MLWILSTHLLEGLRDKKGFDLEGAVLQVYYLGTLCCKDLGGLKRHALFSLSLLSRTGFEVLEEILPIRQFASLFCWVNRTDL